MAVVIPLNVAVTNTFIFFLIDIPSLWSVQRGLLAIQAYYLYRLARSGHTVPLRRSRFPIVGGELLRGVTRWSSLFLAVNVIFLAFLCAATLGVDAGSKKRWERASFRNITSLDMPSSNELRTSFFPATSGFDENGRQMSVTWPLVFRNTVHENRTCRTRNITHARYWPVVFNATSVVPGGNTNWFADNASCQANAIGASPMLTASCVPIYANSTCSLDFIPSIQWGEFVNVSDPLQRRLSMDGMNASVWEENATLARSSSTSEKDDFNPELVGLRVIMFAYQFGDAYPSDSLMLFKDSSSESWFFSSGTLASSDRMRPPIRVSFHGSSSIEYILLALRTNIDVALFMQGFTNSERFTPLSSYELFESILLRIYRGVPLPAAQSAFLQKPNFDTTIIDVRATVLYAIIITFAVVLFPMKEILWFVHVRHGNLRESDLLVYDYDQLSRNNRALTERLNSAPLSGEFASIQFPECNDEYTREEETEWT